jgi:hypothetical protein
MEADKVTVEGNFKEGMKSKISDQSNEYKKQTKQIKQNFTIIIIITKINKQKQSMLLSSRNFF